MHCLHQIQSLKLNINQMKIYVETAAFSFCIIQNITMSLKFQIKYKNLSFDTIKIITKELLSFDELFWFKSKNPLQVVKLDDIPLSSISIVDIYITSF